MILSVRIFSLVEGAERGARTGGKKGRGHEDKPWRTRIWGERRLDEKAGEVERRGWRMDGYLDWEREALASKGWGLMGAGCSAEESPVPGTEARWKVKGPKEMGYIRRWRGNQPYPKYG